MLKYIVLCSLLTFSFAHATSFKVVGGCSDTPLFTSNITIDESINVGKLSVDLFEQENIPYFGSELTIMSIFETPFGAEAYEFLSPNHLRAHGWCYIVDGVEPGVYPSQFNVSKSTKSITWLYGFAEMIEGQWKTQCTPTYSVKPAFLCN